MLIKLCIANAVALWMTSNRDQVVIDAIKAHTTHVETLIIYTVKPRSVPVTCNAARDFMDKWFPPAFKNAGIQVDEMMHSACSATACECPLKDDIVCTTVL